MARMIFKSLLIGVIVILTHIGLLMIASPSDELSYLGSVIDKRELLENHSNGSILIVGGSSAAFAYDSAYLERETGRPVLNTSIHAGLGLRYILNSVVPYVREDDIVLLNLEYTHYISSPDLENSDTLRRIVGIDLPGSVPYLTSIGQWQTILSYHPEYTVNSLWHIIQGEEINCPGGIYCRDSFNEYGDLGSEFIVISESSRAGLQARIDEVNPNDFAQALNHDAINLLNNFNRVVQERNASVWIILPPIPDTIFDPAVSDLNNIADTLSEEVNIAFLNQAEGYPVEYFLDTIYHLNSEGREIYTADITSRLQSVLNP